MELLISDLTKNTIQTAMKNFIHIPHGIVGKLDISVLSNSGTLTISVSASEAYVPLRVLVDDGSSGLKHGIFKVENIDLTVSIVVDIEFLWNKGLYLVIEPQKEGVLYDPKVRIVPLDYGYFNSDLFSGCLKLCTFGNNGKYDLNPEAFQVFNVFPRFEAPVLTNITDYFDIVLLDGVETSWDDIISMDFEESKSILSINMNIDIWSITGDRSWVSDIDFCIKSFGAKPIDIGCENLHDELYLITPDSSLRYFTMNFELTGKGEDIKILIPGDNLLFQDIPIEKDGMMYPELAPLVESFLNLNGTDPQIYYNADTTNELDHVSSSHVDVATLISDTTNEQWRVLKPSRESLMYNEEKLMTNLDDLSSLSGLVGRGIGEQKETKGGYLFRLSSGSGVQGYSNFKSIMKNVFSDSTENKTNIDQVGFELIESERKTILSQNISLLSKTLSGLFRTFPVRNIVFEKAQMGELLLTGGNDV